MSRAVHETGGFTLVELLVASIVLAILLALAAPPLGRGERRWAAYAAGRTLAAGGQGEASMPESRDEG